MAISSSNVDLLARGSREARTFEHSNNQGIRFSFKTHSNAHDMPKTAIVQRGNIERF